MTAGSRIAAPGAGQAPIAARLRCWGDFALSDATTGRDLKPRGRKARALLAYLALHPGRSFSRERLAGLLWGDRGEEQARASLRQALVELKPLGAGGSHALLVERDQIALRPGALRTDLDELRDAAVREDYPALLEALQGTDEPLFANLDGIDEAFDDWLRIERARQREALVEIVGDATATAAAAGEGRAARQLWARQRELDPSASSLPPLPPPAPLIIGQERPVQVGESLEKVPARPGLWRSWSIAAFLALLVLAVVASVARWRSEAPAPPATIAVLPFRDVSGGDKSFAEGLSEEVMAQLAREPGLRVAGRASSWHFKDRTADLREVGRKLGVSYILEGSVRSASGSIRVNVALAKASDGFHLWAATFEGEPGDVLAIQHRIGASVAGALGRKLAQAKPSGALAPTGEVYSLYLGARGLIRERSPVAMAAAEERLARAAALEPSFAPIWSSLAQVARFHANQPGPEGQRKRDEAVGHARKALSLAPDLAEAYGVLGMILGFDDPVGQQHVKRAAALDPGSAEFQFWLGHVHANELDFPRMLSAYRRASEIDPLWRYAQFQLVESSWQMGRQQEALDHARRVERDASRYEAHLLRAMLARARGDFSAGAAELTAAIAATSDPGRKRVADYRRAFILYSLGMHEEARTEWTRVWGDGGIPGTKDGSLKAYELHSQIRRGKLPTIAELRALGLGRSERERSHAAIAAKMLINAGRARDVVALHARHGSFFAIDRPSGQLAGGPNLAAALRALGRNSEADDILLRLERTIGAALTRSRGEAPAIFFAESAAVWAMLGKPETALSALETARRRGWAYVEPGEGDASLPDIAGEPAFRSLLGNARFERLRSELNAHLARERRELRAARRNQAVETQTDTAPTI